MVLFLKHFYFHYTYNVLLKKKKNYTYNGSKIGLDPCNLNLWWAGLIYQPI